MNPENASSLIQCFGPADLYRWIGRILNESSAMWTSEVAHIFMTNETRFFRPPKQDHTLGFVRPKQDHKPEHVL